MPKIKVNCEFLTPVSIGNGSENILSPDGDFIQIRDHFHYLNHRVVEEALSKEPVLIEDYTNGILSGMEQSRTRSKFDLQSFLQDKLNLSVEEYTKIKIPLQGENRHKTQIQGIIKNVGYPYIPGSTIKGGMKTALLYMWLISDQEGKGKLRLFQSQLKQRGDFRELYRIFQQQIVSRFEKRFETTKKIFSISDSDLIHPQDMAVALCYRIHLRQDKTLMPQLREVLPQGIKCGFGFKYNISSIANLMKDINAFYLDSMIEESVLLHDYGHEMNADAYDALNEFYKHMESLIDHAPDNTAYMRIGFGKSYYANAVGMALGNPGDKQLFKKFIQTFNLGRRNQSVFPVTRTIDSAFNPLGWIKLTLNEV